MTKEKILTMEAGEELDRTIAESLGYTVVKSSSTGKLEILLLQEDTGAYFFQSELPKYSTDLSAASQVLNELKKEWDCIILLWDVCAWDIVLENYDTHKKFYLGKESGMTYEGLPKAICMTALLVRLEKP